LADQIRSHFRRRRYPQRYRALVVGGRLALNCRIGLRVCGTSVPGFVTRWPGAEAAAWQFS
jgi:hypothetical protein